MNADGEEKGDEKLVRQIIIDREKSQKIERPVHF
jgi:hypothetical protein